MAAGMTRWCHTHHKSPYATSLRQTSSRARCEAIDPARAHKDAKTALQEFLQSRRRELPHYQMMDISGPSHAQIFTVRCQTDALEQPVIAQGPSRRKAEQAAAEAALRLLRE